MKDAIVGLGLLLGTVGAVVASTHWSDNSVKNNYTYTMPDVYMSCYDGELYIHYGTRVKAFLDENGKIKSCGEVNDN